MTATHHGAAPLPGLVIAGAAKAGTTSLAEYLNRHPKVAVSSQKESEYFARDDIYAKGPDWYRALFPEHMGADTITCDGSTLYSLYPHFPYSFPRLVALNPDVKVIYLVREPISRAYSYYSQLTRNRFNETGDPQIYRTFEECLFPDQYPNRAPRQKFMASFDAHLPDTPDLFLDGGNYERQLAHMLRHIGRDQLLVMASHDFQNLTEQSLKRVCHFLQISYDNSMLDNGEITTNSRDEYLSRRKRRVALQSFSQMPGASLIKRLIPTNIRRSLAKASLPFVKSPTLPTIPPMQTETKDWLAEYYKVPNQRLYDDFGICFHQSMEKA